MCIVIDINTLHLVFSDNDTDFTPIQTWVTEGDGKIVYGGSSYIREIPEKYRRFFKLLTDAGRACLVENNIVDTEEDRIKSLVDKQCDDPHIIAIISVSGCKLLCSKDSRSYKYIKERSLYQKGRRPPKIYRKRKNSSLLIQKNIANCCLK